MRPHHNKRSNVYPTYLPTYLPTNQPTYLPTKLPTYLPTYLPTNQPTNLPHYYTTEGIFAIFVVRRRQSVAFHYVTKHRTRSNILDILENPGIDPGTSRMQSERSSI